MPFQNREGSGAEPIVVVCAADSAYAVPMAVMLQSLATHADPARKIDVYIIARGLSTPLRERIGKQARPSLRIHWQDSIASTAIGEPPWGHVSIASYDRLLIPGYLPDAVTRVLWLDCDLLVLDDVSRLFDQAPTGEILRAVRDPLVRCLGSPYGVRHWKALGLARDLPYFNAGVMLIDMVRWRAAGVTERALGYLQRFGKDVFFHDQEALNAVVGRDWKLLEDRWNFSVNPFHARRQDRGQGQPAIIHFAGRIKPWSLPELGATQDLYFQYLDQTSWRGTRPARTAGSRLLSWYAQSRLRHISYPLENYYLRLRRRLGR